MTTELIDQLLTTYLVHSHIRLTDDRPLVDITPDHESTALSERVTSSEGAEINAMLITASYPVHSVDQKRQVIWSHEDLDLTFIQEVQVLIPTALTQDDIARSVLLKDEVLLKVLYDVALHTPKGRNVAE